MNLESRYKRAGIYIAPPAYGVPVDLEEALESCKTYVKKHECLKLMRIYHDENVTVIRTSGHNGRRMPLGVTGNDAWRRLLKDTETSLIETVIVYAARTVAPSISGIANLIREYFLPCGIGFVDVESGFNSETGNVDEYLRRRTREYRSTLYGKKAAE